MEIMSKNNQEKWILSNISIAKSNNFIIFKQYFHYETIYSFKNHTTL